MKTNANKPVICPLIYTHFSKPIIFEGKMIYDTNSHAYNMIRLPNFIIHLFPHLKCGKSKFKIYCFSSIHSAHNFLKECKYIPAIIHLNEFVDFGKGYTKLKNLLLTNITQKDRVLNGTTYKDKHSRIYSILRMPAEISNKVFPDIRRQRSVYTFMLFPSMEMLLEYTATLNYTPLFLHFYEINIV